MCQYCWRFCSAGLSELWLPRELAQPLCVQAEGLCACPPLLHQQRCLFLATVITLPWGRRKAWLQQPVKLPARPGEACAGSAELCVHQLRHCCPRLCPSLVFRGSWRVQLVHREAPDCAHWSSGAAVGTGKGTGCWVSFPVERSKPFQWSVCFQLFPVQLSCTFSGDLVTHLTVSYSCFLQALSPKHSLGLLSTFYFSGSDKCDTWASL